MVICLLFIRTRDKMVMTIQQQRMIFGGYAVCSMIATYYRFLQLNDTSSNYYVLASKFSQGDSAIILGNMTAVITLIVGNLLQKLIFGELRLIESEHLYERSWSTILGLIMSGSIYKSGDNIIFLVMYACGLIFGKTFHSILCDRLDASIQQYYQINMVDHHNVKKTLIKIIFNRIILTLVLLLKIDFNVIKSHIDESFTHKSPMLILISFEFFILFMELIYSTIKYVVNVYEIYYIERNLDEEKWFYKVWVESVFKLIIDLIKSIMIPTFFVYSISIGTFQFCLITESFRSFYGLGTSIKTLVRLVQNFRKLNNMLQNPTIEEMKNIDMCIICRDELEIDGNEKNESKKPKKLPCGHILHDGCIRSWLQMSTACPTCRKEVFSKDGEINSTIVDNDIGRVEIEERVEQVGLIEERIEPVIEPVVEPTRQPETVHDAERVRASNEDNGYDYDHTDYSDNETDEEGSSRSYNYDNEYAFEGEFFPTAADDMQYYIDNGMVTDLHENFENREEEEEEGGDHYETDPFDKYRDDEKWEYEKEKKKALLHFPQMSVNNSDNNNDDDNDIVKISKRFSKDWIILKTQQTSDGNISVPMNEARFEIKKQDNDFFLSKKIQKLFPNQYPKDDDNE